MTVNSSHRSANTPIAKRLGAIAAWLLLGACLVLPVAAARADISQKDLQITARALSFMEKPPIGETRLGIVYDPNDPRSAAQAQAVKKMLASGMKVGNLVLKPVMVELGQAARANVDLFFLTEHLGEGSADIADISEAEQIPCITVDIAQVRQGACVMGVRSRPKIEILVNRQAAANSGMKFATAFRMMIHYCPVNPSYCARKRLIRRSECWI